MGLLFEALGVLIWTAGSRLLHAWRRRHQDLADYLGPYPVTSLADEAHRWLEQQL